MRLPIVFCLILGLLPSMLGFDLRPQVIFWNTGQGLWVTAVEEDQCLHFDMGGEFFSKSKVDQACRAKKNSAFFSHWDWDHISFATSLKNSNFCVALLPSSRLKENSRLINKKRSLLSLPTCQKKIRQVRQIKFQSSIRSSENDRSHILVFANWLLLPGDSTRKMEKKWAHQVDRNIKALAVGHHGSKTSSSIHLFHRIRPSIAVSSARKRVYGHPHARTVEIFKRKGIPMVTTEDWGNIRIIKKIRLSF